MAGLFRIYHVILRKTPPMTQPEITVCETIEFSKSTYFFRSDGIIEICLKDGSHMEIEDSMEEYRFLREKKDYLPMVFLINPGKDTTVSKEVRDFANSEAAAKITRAQAIVVDNLAHKIMANFIMRFYKTSITIKVFSDREKALKWLRQFVQPS